MASEVGVSWHWASVFLASPAPIPKRCARSAAIDDRKPHVDARRSLVLVLDFRLRQGRAAVHAPVHGLVALVHMAVLDDEGEGAQLIGFEARRHGHVGMIPIAEHPQPLEIAALRVDLLVRVFAAGRAKRLGVDLLSDAPVRLLDLHFDGQPVTIPAGDVGRIVAVQGARLDDDVLEDFVDGVTQMDRAVRIGRTVGQHEGRPALGGGANLLVQAVAFPRREHSGLAVGKIRLHREARVRQVNRRFVITMVISHRPLSTKDRAPARHPSSFAQPTHPRNRI